MNRSDRKLLWLRRVTVSILIIGTAWFGYASHQSQTEVSDTSVIVKETSLRDQADSLRRSMSGMQGEDLLKAHSNLCRLAASGNDMDAELECLHNFIKEAVHQGDKDAEGLARTSLVYCWYNYNLEDSLKQALPAQLAKLKANRTWDYYYNAWSALIDHYLYSGKLRTALGESEEMYAQARNSDNNYGIGVAGYCVGEIYQAMGRYDEARKNLEECITHLQEEDDISLLLAAYNALCETLDANGSYIDLRTTAKEWKDLLDDYNTKAKNAGYSPALEGRYLYCTLATANAEIGLGHLNAAARHLELADQYIEGRKPIARNKYLNTKARYYAARGDYEAAILCNQENIDLLRKAEDSVSLHTIEMQQAEYLMLAGRFEESAELYHEIRPFHDELRNRTLAGQIDELSTLYEVDKLSLENHIARDIVIYITLICMIMLVVIGLYIYYNRRLKTKNEILYETLQELQESKKEVIVQAESDTSDKEAILYRKLCDLMEKEKLYASPTIRREFLAERLGTNRTYLANAVKKYHGGTISEFINDIRLKYAASMLTEDIGRNVNEVEESCGFNSRTTFTRLFREKYGMTPTEYRAISKEHQVS